MNSRHIVIGKPHWMENGEFTASRGVEENGGEDDALSRERLNDVARDSELRVVEKRKGGVKTERGIECSPARYSTLHCYPRESAHHD